MGIMSKPRIKKKRWVGKQESKHGTVGRGERRTEKMEKRLAMRIERRESREAQRISEQLKERRREAIMRRIEPGQWTKSSSSPSAQGHSEKVDEKDEFDLLDELQSIEVGNVVLVNVNVRGQSRHQDVRLAEASRLVDAVGWRIGDGGSIQFNVAKVTPGSFIGSGQLDMLADAVEELSRRDAVGAVVFNAALSGAQLNRLQTTLGGVRVLDRTGLILEIFRRRASDAESKLQVALAATRYERSHLIGAHDSHFAGQQQRGGTRKLAGSGETQLERDRRMLDERETALTRKLASIAKTRALQARSRRYPLVALVGYTNSGKSALLNRLTGAHVDSCDLLFASLDTHTRAMRLPSGQRALLVDTVGFVSDLPTELVPSFRSTLEQVLDANLLVHVRDIANEESERQRRDVLQVLRDLGVPDGRLQSRLIEVHNKIDLLDDSDRDAQLDHAIVDDGDDDFDIDALLESSGAEIELAVVDNQRLHSLDDFDIDDDGDDDDDDALEMLGSNSEDEGEASAPTTTVQLSALNGDGCGQLLKHIDDMLTQDYAMQVHTVVVPAYDQRRLKFCFKYADVLSRDYDYDEHGWRMRLLMDESAFYHFQQLPHPRAPELTGAIMPCPLGIDLALELYDDIEDTPALHELEAYFRRMPVDYWHETEALGYAFEQVIEEQDKKASLNI
jgi:GTP-binding protein HflX